jgi:acyl-CoA reductase-like NAD-dependent aldehyde dehydrogenase
MSTARSTNPARFAPSSSSNGPELEGIGKVIADGKALDRDGYLGGTDLKRACEVADRIASGTVWVNKHLDLPPDIPFGGAKQSGFGAEMGQEGLEAFTQSKIVNMAK